MDKYDQADNYHAQFGSGQKAEEFTIKAPESPTPLEESLNSIHDYRDRLQRIVSRMNVLRIRLSGPYPERPLGCDEDKEKEHYGLVGDIHGQLGAMGDEIAEIEDAITSLEFL